jgi:hypothetical protein
VMNIAPITNRAIVRDCNLCNSICVIDHPPDGLFCKTETCNGVNISEVNY